MSARNGCRNKSGIVSSKLCLLAFAALFAVLPVRAFAYDGTTEGRIYVIQYAADGFAFSLAGQSSLCTTGSPFAVWAAVGARWGHTPDTTKQMLSAVTTAYLSGRSIRVYADNSPDGNCRATVLELLPW
jgi:hypothetical protein